MKVKRQIWPIFLILFLALSCGSKSHESNVVLGSIYDGFTDKENFFENVIHYKTNKGTTCTGTIINPYLILTAAHCIHDTKVEEVYLGKEYRKNKVKKLEILKTFIPKDFKMKNGGVYPENDIALIVLKSKLSFPESKIIKILDKETYDDLNISRGDKLTIAGFGKTESLAYSRARKFKEVKVKRRNFFCGDRAMKKVWSLEIGAGNGDSGGPAFYKKGNDIYQIGTTTAGALYTDKRCRSSYYTNIIPHIKWMKESTGFNPSQTVSENSRAIERAFNIAKALVQDGTSNDYVQAPRDLVLNINDVSVRILSKSYLQKKMKIRVLAEHCLSLNSCEPMSVLWEAKNFLNIGKAIGSSFIDFKSPLSQHNSVDDFIKLRLQIVKNPKKFSSYEEKVSYRKLTMDKVDKDLIETISTIKIPTNLALNFTQQDIDENINLKRYAVGNNENDVNFKVLLNLEIDK